MTRPDRGRITVGGVGSSSQQGDHVSVREQAMIRKEIRWESVREYAGGALWLLPFLAANAALVLGYLVSRVRAPSLRLRVSPIASNSESTR